MPHLKKHRKSSSCSSSSSSSKSEKRHHCKSNSDKKQKKSSSDKKNHSNKSNCSYVPFCEVYERYKHALLCDPSLMIGGSDAYISVYGVEEQVITSAGAVQFNYQQVSKNVLHNTNGYGSYLRKAGVYCAEFVSYCQDPCQFMYHINSIPNFQAAVGRNAGGGGLINRTLLTLDVDDDITIRNYLSNIGTVTLGTAGGGDLSGTNAELVLRKIAPHPNACLRDCCDKKKDEYYEKKLCKLSKKKRCLFEKLLCALENDPDIQLNGSQVRGSFYRTNPLDVPLNTAVTFEAQSNVNGLVLQPNNQDILISEDGIYNMIYLVECTKACQFTFFQNGNPILNTTSGLNKSGNQLYLRQILPLNQGDLVNIRNYISSVGTITIKADAGGTLPGTNCILILEKIAPLPNPNNICMPECCDLPKDIMLFKKYLETKCYLMPRGSDAYFNIVRTTYTSVAIGYPLVFAYATALHNVGYHSGTPEVYIHKDGIYELYVDLCMDKASQFTIFVNGIANNTTVNGTDAAEGQSSIRQLVALNAGDVLTVVNNASFLANIYTVPNAGGNLVGNAIIFSGIRIAPLCTPCKPCKQ